VTIFGDGLQTRHFVYVSDLADLLVRAIDVPATFGKVMNIGRGVECSLLELLDTLEQLSGLKIERRHEAARMGDILRSCADTARLKALMGGVPETTMKDGLAELLRYSGVELAA